MTRVISRRRFDGPQFESLAPELQRAFGEAFGEIVNDYYAGKNSRYLPRPSGVNPMGSSADYHYRTERTYMNMLERSRCFDRDNMVVGQGVNRLVANVVQNGFTLDVNTGDDEIDADLLAYFNEWAEDPDACDYAGELCFAEMEALALRSTIVDGDITPIPTRPGAVQWFEGHQLRNPYRRKNNIVHGVELAGSRKRIRYWLTPDNIDPLQVVNARSDVRPIDARDAQGYRQVWHLYQPRRFSQTRGVTAFAPSVVPISYHDDLQFSAMVKAKVASFVAIFREFEFADDPNKLRRSDRQAGARTTETQADGSTRTIEEGSPGQQIKGDPGEKLKGFSPNIPNPEFFPHASLILTFVAINLDLPLQLLLLDPTKTNFSGWRGAMDQAKLRFRQLQKWLRTRFHSPVYKWKVRQRMAADPLLRRAAARSGIDIFGHVWHAPRWPYIEPLKDIAADDMEVSRNLTSQRRRFAARGNGNWDEVSTEIVEDRASLVVKAFDKAEALKKEKPGLEVDWRELAYGHKSDGIQLQFGGEIGEAEQITTGEGGRRNTQSQPVQTE